MVEMSKGDSSSNGVATIVEVGTEGIFEDGSMLAFEAALAEAAEEAAAAFSDLFVSRLSPPIGVGSSSLAIDSVVSIIESSESAEAPGELRIANNRAHDKIITLE
jgi:hypothetical protein